MSRFLILGLALGLSLSGCHRAAPEPGPKSGAGPDPRADAPPMPKLPVAFTPRTGRLVSQEEVPLLEQINRENIRVLAAAMPTIVRITAKRPDDPHVKVTVPFQFRFGQGAPRNVMRHDPDYGSGVIISQDGYIVTNYHVVGDSPDVQVQLQDKRTFPARLIASDSPMDVAVLKIEAKGLPALSWGDSSRVRVGEQIFALGNPFNLEDSVSQGIVSATGRNLPESSTEATHYENFIQIDAAINPGNSGGALVNIHGELIGINTAIASTSGGNEGVGFAIPSNFARYAVEGLLKDGRLIRGDIGLVWPDSVDEGVIASLHLDAERGALLAGVQPESPAAKAGLLAGDFITGVDGHKINGTANLRIVVSQLSVGKEVAINYIRAGAAQETVVKVAELPQTPHTEVKPVEGTAKGPELPPIVTDNAASTRSVLSDLQVNDLDDKSRQKYDVDAGVVAGVIVSGVADGSAAEAKGLMRGDVIESACLTHGTTEPLTQVKDFIDFTQRMKPDQSVVLLVHHGKTSSFIYLTPQK